MSLANLPLRSPTSGSRSMELAWLGGMALAGWASDGIGFKLQFLNETLILQH